MTNQHNHTPGPWTAPGNTNVVGADGSLVVSVPRPKGKGATARRDANVRLISAAPELLNALIDSLAVARNLRQLLGTITPSTQLERETNTAMHEMASAFTAKTEYAITKATQGA